MSEPVHCPYLGLRQNRAIRFAAPTPEHRCYREGAPIDIPVDQRAYCLTARHVACPLYTGQWDASTQGVAAGRVGASGSAAATLASARAAGRTSSAGASRRNRVLYWSLVLIVASFAAFWGAALYQAWRSQGTLPPQGGIPSPTSVLPVVIPPTAGEPTATATATATVVPPPTATFTPTATISPTASATFTPTVQPTFPPIPTVTAPVVVPEPTVAPPSSTPEPPTAEPPTAPPTEAPPTEAPPSAEPTVVPPTEVPVATEAPPTDIPMPTATTAPPVPAEPTATIRLQLTVLPQQQP